MGQRHVRVSRRTTATVLIHCRAKTKKIRTLRQVSGVKSGSPLQVAKVLRDLAMIRADKGELSYGEKKLMEQARKLLITELALARRVREETIERDIDKILN